MNKKRLIKLSIFLLLILTLFYNLRNLFQSGNYPTVSEDEVSLSIIEIEENDDGLKTIIIEITNNSEYILTENVLHLYSDLEEQNDDNSLDSTTSSKKNQNSSISYSSIEEASRITNIDGVFNLLQPGAVVKVELSLPESIATEDYRGLRFRNAYIIDVEDHQRYGNTLVKKILTDF